MVMRVGVGAWRSSGGWRHCGRRRGLSLPEPCSQRASRCGVEQVAANLVKLGQRELGLRAGQVLCDASVPELAEAPQLFDDAKEMLAARPVRERARLFSLQPARSAAEIRASRKLCYVGTSRGRILPFTPFDLLTADRQNVYAIGEIEVLRMGNVLVIGKG